MRVAVIKPNMSQADTDERENDSGSELRFLEFDFWFENSEPRVRELTKSEASDPGLTCSAANPSFLSWIAVVVPRRISDTVVLNVDGLAWLMMGLVLALDVYRPFGAFMDFFFFFFSNW